MINNQPDIDKIYLYAKDPYEAKYQLLINKRESAEVKHFNDSKAYIEYSDDIKDLPAFWLIQQSLSRTRCWMKSLHSGSKLLSNGT